LTPPLIDLIAFELQPHSVLHNHGAHHTKVPPFHIYSINTDQAREVTLLNRLNTSTIVDPPATPMDFRFKRGNGSEGKNFC
jgi:hypothetical protein